jgi:NADH-quinone oxidoreductase subunit L
MSWEFAPAIAVLPLTSFFVALVAGKYMPKNGASAGIIATGGSLLFSVLAFVRVSGGKIHNETLFTWVAADAADLTLNFGILIDPLSAMMLVIVSLVSFLVHVFSLGYMNAEGETGLPRYYAELGFFTFSMLAFVYSSTLLGAFVFFELVGLSSYLLIGFWFREPGPPSAAKKAFLVTRFGDYFFLIGMIGIAVTFFQATAHPLRFAGEGSFPVVAEETLAHATEGIYTAGFGTQTWFTILGLLVLGGVIGKSAQFPLHTWLPDAMEGPTTVSALIHAATMVAAGVYLVARMYGFYALLPGALAVIAVVGGFTALFAATMGVVKDDIKQVLAYSTISQYGYMMLGLGAGGFVAGTFHLMNHAFFKALLFLGAGSVIVMMHHTQDMWEMGGLKDHAPVTYYTFLAGSLALAGIVPFSGFWSKDEILYEALDHGLGTGSMSGLLLLLAYAFGLVAVFFTGFYTFRMVMLTFHGEPRSEDARDPHLPGWSITFPLVVLGVLATVMGLVNMVPVNKLTGANIDYLHQWLDGPEETITAVHHYTELIENPEFAGYAAAELTPLVPAALSLALAVAGAGLAYRLYGGAEPEEHTEKLGDLKTLITHNYYQDEYQVWLAESVGGSVAAAANRFDQGVVDGVVNGVSSVSLYTGSRIKRIQTGVVTNYAALVALGLVVLLIGFGLLGGWF